VADENDSGPGGEGKASGITDDERSRGSAFVLAYQAWNASSEEDDELAFEACEKALLQTAVAYLRPQIGAGSKTRDTALRVVLEAIADRLDGWRWPSLTKNKAGQGVNLRQLRAMAFGHAYIRAAKEGRVLDPDPVATVCTAYARRGDDPLSRDTLSRWARKYSLNVDEHDIVFTGDKERSTENAKVILRKMSKFLQKGPSQAL
jgi:hypothetical protein